MSITKEGKNSTVKRKSTKVTEKKVSERAALDMGMMNIQLYMEEGKGKNIEKIKEIIPSRIDVGTENKFGKTHMINGVQCVIAKDSNYSIKHTKNSEHNIYLGYYLLSTKLKDGDSVSVSIGLPIDIYKNMGERESFAETFRNGGQPIVVNDKSFTIDYVRVCAEGVSAMANQPESEDEIERDTLVVDIGGRNINLAIVDSDCSPVLDSLDTLDEGMHKVIRDLRQRIRSVGEIVTDDNVKFFLHHVSGNDKINWAIMEYIEEYLEMIQRKIDSTKGFHKETTKLLFVGGASALLEEKIMDYFDTKGYNVSVSENALWDNVEGYYEILVDELEEEEM